MLGHKLVQVLGERFDVWTTVRGSFREVEKFRILDNARTVEDLDVEDSTRLEDAIEAIKPEVVVNSIGLIKQVSEAADPDRLFRINSELPQTLGALSGELSFRLICISTDCVFSGKKGNYTENDPPDAADTYGKSKLAGEVTGETCLTIRTSMIGRELETTHSLVEWFLSNVGGHVKGYKNAIYTGFPTIVLSRIIAGIIADHPGLHGIYHVSSDPINKFELLKLINKHFDTGVGIEPDDSFVIDRSLDSSRFRTATGFKPEPWDVMVRQMTADPTPYDTWHKK